MIVLKNVSKNTINTIFRGRKLVLKPKHTMVLDEKDEEEKAKAQYLLQTYGFVIDITERIRAERGELL